MSIYVIHILYYKSTNISTAAITIQDANGEWERGSIGVKTATEFEKYEVDLFGNYHRVRKGNKNNA